MTIRVMVADDQALIREGLQKIFDTSGDIEVVGAVADGQERLEIRDVCTLTLSFDHRHVDGESGSRFLADVASMMEDPAAALLF